MGDRTHVTLTLEREAYERIKKAPWFDDNAEVEELGSPLPGHAGNGSRSISTTEAFVTCMYEEVNYGELDFLGELVSRGIAFTSYWEAGGNYGPGTETCRFNADGEVQTLVVSEGEENPPIEQLLKLIDDTQALVNYIRRYHQDTTPWPFKNQGEYGRIYLTKQLLQPNKD